MENLKIKDVKITKTQTLNRGMFNYEDVVIIGKINYNNGFRRFQFIISFDNSDIVEEYVYNKSNRDKFVKEYANNILFNYNLANDTKEFYAYCDSTINEYNKKIRKRKCC